MVSFSWSIGVVWSLSAEKAAGMFSVVRTEFAWLVGACCLNWGRLRIPSLMNPALPMTVGGPKRKQTVVSGWFSVLGMCFFAAAISFCVRARMAAPPSGVHIFLVLALFLFVVGGLHFLRREQLSFLGANFPFSVLRFSSHALANSFERDSFHYTRTLWLFRRPSPRHGMTGKMAGTYESHSAREYDYFW